jgi:hypothetical protein
VPITEQERVWAQETIIAQRLNRWNPLGFGDVVGRRGDQREDILEVGNMGAVSPHEMVELAKALPTPYGAQR